jgi:hypothetical protein
MTRLLYGVLIALTTAFIVSSIVQVARELFSQEHPKVTGACAVLVEELFSSVESSLGSSVSSASSVSSVSSSGAVDAGDGRAEKAWSGYPESARACDADPSGKDALAAVERYRRSALRHGRDLARVRRAAMSFIR